VIPELLPLAIVVMVLSGVVLGFVLRGYKRPARGDALPASVPITLSEPDIERLAVPVAEAIRESDPQARVTAAAIVDAVRRGAAEITSTGVIDESLRFRIEGFEVTVDRGGRVLDSRRQTSA
jgi:hypothetical protein